MSTNKHYRIFLIGATLLLAWTAGGPNVFAASNEGDIYRTPRTAATSLADQMVIRSRILLRGGIDIADHQYRRARVLLDLALELAPNDPYIMRLRYDLARETEGHAQQLETLRNYLKVVKDDDALQLEYVRLLVEQDDRMDDRVERVERILAGPSADRLTKALRSRLASYCAAGAREAGDMGRFRSHVGMALNLDPTNSEAAIMMYEDANAGPPDVVRRGVSLLWMLRAQPIALEPRRALGEMLLGEAAYEASALQFRGVQAAAGIRLDDQFYHDWAIALAGQGDEGGAYGALQVLGRYGPVTMGEADVVEEEDSTKSESEREEEEEEVAVEPPRLPLDLELIQLAVIHNWDRMPVQKNATYRRIVRNLDALYGEEGTAEIDKALLSAWLGRGDLSEDVINELEVEFGTDNLLIQRMHGWLDFHAGKIESARSTFRNIVAANPADAYAMYGLAESYRAEASNSLRVEYLQELVTQWPGSLPGMLSARDLHRLGVESEIHPAGQRLQNMLDEMPEDLRDPNPYERGWASLRIELPKKRYNLFEPIYATVYLRNTSDIPLAVGADGALPSRVFVIISVHIAGRHMGTMPAIVVDLKRRLALAPGEEVGVKIRLDHSTFGRVLRSNITDVISFDVKALLDPVPLPDGDIKVGLLGTEAMTRDLQRWGKPFDIEAVPRWLSMLEDPNDLRQLEAFSWLGNTAYWLIASAKNGRNTLQRIIEKREREEEEEEEYGDDIDVPDVDITMEVDESEEVTAEQIENLERIISEYEQSSRQISEAYLSLYQSLDPVRQAWLLLFLPPTREVKSQFAPIYKAASESEEAVVRVMYLAASGLRPGDETLEPAVESEDPEVRDFASAMKDIFTQMQQGN